MAKTRRLKSIQLHIDRIFYSVAHALEWSEADSSGAIITADATKDSAVSPIANTLWSQSKFSVLTKCPMELEIVRFSCTIAAIHNHRTATLQ